MGVILQRRDGDDERAEAEAPMPTSLDEYRVARIRAELPTVEEYLAAIEAVQRGDPATDPATGAPLPVFLSVDHALRYLRGGLASLTRTPAEVAALQADMDHWQAVRDAEAVQRVTQADAQTEARDHLIVNVVDYVAAIPTDVPWAAEPFAWFGGVSMLAGIWKGGKSTLMAQLQRCRETGAPFLGHPVATGPTLLLTEEGGIPVMRKVGDLKKLDIIDKRAATTAGLDLVKLIPEVKDWCARQDQPPMVFIDTLAVWGDIEDENSSTEMTLVIGALSELAQETGAAVILVHHVNKAGGTHGRGIRGSSAIVATVDVFAELDYATSGPETNRTLKMEGRLTESMIELTLSYSIEGGYQVAESFDPTEIEVWLSGVPTDRSAEGYSEGDLTALWGMTRNPVRVRIEKLRNLGRLHRSDLTRHPGDRQKSYRYWAIPAQPVPLRVIRGGQDEDDET